MIQELREQVSRAFLLSVFSSGVSATLPAPSALAFLRWNAAANALENVVSIETSGTIISSFMEELLDDANAAAARTTLGLGTAATLSPSAYAQTLLDDPDAATARTTLGLGSIATQASTAFVNTILDDTTADAVQTTLGLTGFQQINGLAIQNNASVPTTSIDVTWTSGFIGRPIVGATVTIDATAAGAANALDAGSLANSTWYSVWIIHNPSNSTTAGLLSTSATSPTLPSGFTLKCRVGWMRTGGSATFLRTKQVGNTARYIVTAGSTTPALPIIVSGTTGNISTPTWTSTAWAAHAPPTATRLQALLKSTSGAAIAAPSDGYGATSSTSNPPYECSTQNSSSNSTLMDMALESSNVYFASNHAGALLAAVGWTDSVPCS